MGPGNSRKDLFTGRADYYVRSRPSYPNAVMKILRENHGFTSDLIVADIGCGPGILSRIFLQNGNEVFCIDPNEEMLSSAKRLLSEFGKVKFLRTFAEKTGLDNNSVNVISAGQAFHWFTPEETRNEFKRILKPPGLMILLWNDRTDRPGSYNAEYERIVKKYSPEYHRSGSLALDSKAIQDFYGSGFTSYELRNSQSLDFDGTLGRYLSASYAIGSNNSDYETLLRELEEAFESYQVNGKVAIEYKTRIYVGSVLND